MPKIKTTDTDLNGLYLDLKFPVVIEKVSADSIIKAICESSDVNFLVTFIVTLIRRHTKHDINVQVSVMSSIYRMITQSDPLAVSSFGVNTTRLIKNILENHEVCSVKTKRIIVDGLRALTTNFERTIILDCLEEESTNA